MLNPQTIGVIVGRDLVGDALIKLPFARALRNTFPKANIQWITSQGPTAFGGVLREATRNLIDQIHECPEWMAGKAPAPHFDLLIDTRGRWRTTLAARKIPHGMFLASAMRFLFSDRRPPLFKPRPQHLCDRLLQYVELAAGYLPPSTGSLPVPQDLIEKAKKILPDDAVAVATDGTSGAAPSRPNKKIYVGLAPGCSTPLRMWPRDRFIQLAQMQAAHGHVPVFILGPLEQDAHEQLKAAVPSALFPLQDFAAWGTKTMTLDHTLALGTRLDLAVANDSGPGHILAAVDCRILSLFGPTTPLKAAPRTSRGRSLRAQDFGGEGMSDIPVDAVNKAVNDMLSAPQQSR